jgi:VanZ family protein
MISSARPAGRLQASWRRICVVGAVLVASVDVSLSVLAYLGRLPSALPTENGGDKVGHFLMFGGLAFFVDGAAHYRRLGARAPSFAHAGPVWLWVVVAIDEWAQRFSPTRTSELADLVADTLGIAAFALLSSAFDTWLGRRAMPPAAAPAATPQG